MTLHCAPPRPQSSSMRATENDWGICPPHAASLSLTVAVLGDWETRWGLGPVVKRLAGLAVNDELLIVYGTERRYRPGDDPVVSRLREQLPRHHVIARYRRSLGTQDTVLVERFLENGSLPVIVTPVPATHRVAAELASRLQADRVVRMSWTLDGVDVGEVWHRTAAGSR